LGEQRWIITNEDFEAKKKQLLGLYTGLHLPASFIKGLNPWVKLAGRFLMRWQLPESFVMGLYS
jgi:hypothetical protein